MSRTNLLFPILAFLSLLSCSKEQSEGDKSALEIQISASLSDEFTKASSVVEDITARRIHLDGYTTDGSVHSADKHLNANALYEGGWKFYTSIKDVHYYWPQKSNLDIFAYSPADLSHTCCAVERTAAFHNKVTCTNLPLDDHSAEALALEEFICVEKNNCKKTDGAVNLEFKRPFAVVKFKLDQAVRSDLNFIRITGIYNSGYLDCSVSPWAWTVTGAKGNFQCDVYKNYPSEINNESDLGGPFVMIPQSLRSAAVSPDEPVQMEFNYKTIGNETPTTTFVKLGTSSTTHSVTVNEWKPGYSYTYYISLLGAAGEVKMSVVCEVWDPQGRSETIVQ